MHNGEKDDSFGGIKLNSTSLSIDSKKKKFVITLEQKFDVIEQHELGHTNTKIAQSVGMPESIGYNIIKMQGK